MARHRPSLLIATTNPAKAERLKRCLEGGLFDTYGPESLPSAQPPLEEGESHRSIAEAKAAAWSRLAGGLAIASDGGMVIPVLGTRWDSLTTKRAAGEEAQDEERLDYLLRLMEPYNGDDRRAFWTEAVVLARNGEGLQTWEVEGPIGYIARASSPARIPGFWAASLWFFPHVGKWYTELSPDELRAVGDPWTRLTDQIQTWLRNGGWKTLGGREDSFA